MITPDKTYTDNPFVDNVIYYAKLLAMNCVIKDDDEALANETPESLRAGDVLIACVEGTATYELFQNIPKEILEKYIASYSNLDLYTKNVESLKLYLKSLPMYDRKLIEINLGKIARSVYIDHYNIMMSYIDSLGEDWEAQWRDLYDECVAGTATYEDLFPLFHKYTKTNILNRYITNYDERDLSELAEDLDKFNEYIESRTDTEQIQLEVSKVSKAMREVFISHFEMLEERGYIREFETEWESFADYPDVFTRCKQGTSDYSELYDLFPPPEDGTSLTDVLVSVLGADAVETYQLDMDEDNLDNYFENYSPDPEMEIAALNEAMMERYLANYSLYLNLDVYGKCIDGVLDYFDLVKYIPPETLKMIINTQIEEVTNLDVYSQKKGMLNSYLSSIPTEQRNTIKQNITKDMVIWYPEHHVETNNYYRALIGLPPMGSDGKVYFDSIERSYNADTNTYFQFGNRFTSQISNVVYPAIHWVQEIYNFDAYDISMLNESNILEELVQACGSTMNSPRYKYMKYLGDEKLDLYTCRRAMNFQLIGIPTIDDSEAKKIFTDCYATNRDYVIRTVYSDAYKFQSDYYNKFIIIFILVNTIMDMLTGVPELIIDREVFDSRCIKYLFESLGVPYYSEIPLKYQRAMLRNINILLKYKSSTRNMVDICALFGFHDVQVFDYYMFKKRNIDPDNGKFLFDDESLIDYDLDLFYIKDDNGEIIDDAGQRYSHLIDYREYDEEKYTRVIQVQNEDGEGTHDRRIIRNDADVYIKDTSAEGNEYISLQDTTYFSKIRANIIPTELKFIQVPIQNQLTDFKNDPDCINDYDEITLNDEGDTWDGGLQHEFLKNKIINTEFNAVKSKYISVETITEMAELSFQVTYFYNMLFDNAFNEDKLTVKIPALKIGHNFRFTDVICYLFSLAYLYNGLQDKIMYSPSQILYVKGYNYNEALNEVVNDPNCFQQYDVDTGEPLAPDKKYDIFDVNERIAEDGYDYREAFENYRIRGFNLEADLDELERWLNKNHQMSLDDFIVDDSLTEFDHIITVRSFFSLNNSYYQKDIFDDDLVVPLPYNQDIKYAYNYALYEKHFISDMSAYLHEYVRELGYWMEVINNRYESNIYVLDYATYARVAGDDIAIYTKYTMNSDGEYEQSDLMPYVRDGTADEKHTRLYTGDIGILDLNHKYCFAADKYYRYSDADKEFIEVTESWYYSQDPNYPDKLILNYGLYYIQDSHGRWVLDPEYAYIRIVTPEGEVQYIKATDSGDYDGITISEDLCYVRHSDGHFINLPETDYYRRMKDNDDYWDLYKYIEEECFIKVNEPTEWFDPSDPNDPPQYYKPIGDYYREHDYIIYTDEYYVPDPNHPGEFIPESHLMNPSNCYFKNIYGYQLVKDHMANYRRHTQPMDVQYILVLQDDNDYLKYAINDETGNYVYFPDSIRRYVYDSDTNYINVLMKNVQYHDTQTVIVVFNKGIMNHDDIDNIINDDSRYNPEKTDNVWDENDWYYEGYDSDSEPIISTNGENIWYYRKPGGGSGGGSDDDDDGNVSRVGSGFYFDAESYLGDIELEAGESYYVAFDIETNFKGKIQIYNEADIGTNDTASRVYEVGKGEVQHLYQLFTANDISRPAWRFLIYDYSMHPIKVGDYVVVSNIRFIKSYNNNYIPQDIPSYDRLQELYKTNEAIYKWLVTQMVECSDIYRYRILEKLYESLMLSKYNKEVFKLSENKYAKTYTEFLHARDPILYDRLIYFKSLNEDTMHKMIADDIIEVCYAIDDCVDTYSYGYLYSYFPAVSANYIQQYITKLINWFKSWKVHMLGINTTYRFNDPLENTVKILEGQQYRERVDNIQHNVHVHDVVKIYPLDSWDSSGYNYTDKYPDFFPYNLPYREHVGPVERIRIIVREANYIRYTDDYGNLHVVFNDNDFSASVGNENELVLHSSKSSDDAYDGVDFTVVNTDSGIPNPTLADKNKLLMTTDETLQQAFAGQVLGQINYTSFDYLDLDWEALDDDDE